MGQLRIKKNLEIKKLRSIISTKIMILMKYNLKILIAGYGTGQHSTETALRFPKSKVLAIDLSKTSLAYATRKTKELKIKILIYASRYIDMKESQF